MPVHVHKGRDISEYGPQHTYSKRRTIQAQGDKSSIRQGYDEHEMLITAMLITATLVPAVD